jgi:hypothetical protein
MTLLSAGILIVVDFNLTEFRQSRPLMVVALLI